MQEFYGLLPANNAYNAVRSLMHEAALSVDFDPRRLSFIHAVRPRETAPLMRAAPTSRLPILDSAMIQHIAPDWPAAARQPHQPRVIKKKLLNLGQKRPEHYRATQPKTSFQQSVMILRDRIGVRIQKDDIFLVFCLNKALRSV